MIRSGAVLLVLCVVSGCALRTPADMPAGVRSAAPPGAPPSSLEAQDPILAAALLEIAVAPGPSQHRRAAARFRDLKVLDAAYDHFARARTLDPTDAAAYEGLARIWRDWGFPHLGLADATRSVYYAPSSASAHNTLGTMLAATGQGANARRAYQRALGLDPRAGYALNNLCYLSFLEGRAAQAIEECRAALALEPGLVPARNNLALAYAAARRHELSRREFLAAGGAAAGLYNIGIVHLAEKRYVQASEAFAAAQRQRPSWDAARRRARATRALAAAAARDR